MYMWCSCDPLIVVAVSLNVGLGFPDKWATCNKYFFHEDFSMAAKHLFQAIDPPERVALGTLFREPSAMRVAYARSGYRKNISASSDAVRQMHKHLQNVKTSTFWATHDPIWSRRHQVCELSLS